MGRQFYGCYISNKCPDPKYTVGMFFQGLCTSCIIGRSHLPHICQKIRPFIFFSAQTVMALAILQVNVLAKEEPQVVIVLLGKLRNFQKKFDNDCL